METKQPNDTPQPAKGTPYKDMTPRQKVVWVLKLAISIMSFGIAFPNVMSD